MRATGSRFSIVPAHFFDPADSFDILERESKSLELPVYGAWFVYDASLDAVPVLYEMLLHLPECPDYNKIRCSWDGQVLSLAIGQGSVLMLASEYPAADFVTAEYFLMLAVKSLQLNPEISTVVWDTPLEADQEEYLYRYFKSVECA